MVRQIVRAVGIAWYHQQDYHRILDIMEDADLLPAGYDEWLKSAETGERQLKRSGQIVVRAVINPDEFPSWCRTRSLKIDAEGRMRWANEAALRQVKGMH